MIALDTDLLVYAHRDESPFHAAAFESVLLLAKLPAHWRTLRALRVKAESVGPAVHDARIAALCLQHGVGELWSADREFGRFAAQKVVNPLV